MTVLVTGGAGYIGSHVVRLLVDRGDDVLVVDDFSTGIESRVEGLPVVSIDLAAADAEDRLVTAIEEHSVDSIIHFAAKKQVGESVEQPLMYYRQNIGGLMNILAAVDRTGVESLVFSSSAATYGMPDVEMVAEDLDCRPINPYGQTKLIGEWMIDNAITSATMRGTRFNAVKLRYFNVAGAGWPELADTAVMNLIPIVLERVAAGKSPIIFGDDYDTPDGTCIRDYVHVKDLAEAHIASLDYMKSGQPAETVFNVGTGRGASVKEVIDAIAEATGREIVPVMGERRAGDPPVLVADASRIAAQLSWKAEFGLDEIVRSAVEAAGMARTAN
ncbi:UDP-galactose 4-epimerase [Brevibacterium sanguinis]|uniref:UDP-glucose 4-epimerase n=2 Tax=Brevibacterium TaxID=1696 RepID=A0A366IML5_9MICO|nr:MULTISPECIES: UDP-glucose 4-epimerase GalE [Brevibacterium]RBP61695.1 UDP-galactose 4-epimerase [Brevibacterium sanguinis]RBP74324.1 UDP-galactose 4-epimerase [Brevibacterium celere]